MRMSLSIMVGAVGAAAGLVTLAATAPSAAAVASVAQAPTPAITDEQITAAQNGIVLYALDAIVGTTSGECPVVSLGQLGYWMGQLGMTGTTQGYGVDSYVEQSISEAFDEDAWMIECGVPILDFVDTADPAAPYAAMVYAYDLYDGVTFRDVVDMFDAGLTPIPSPDANLGGEIAVACGQPGRVVCITGWHRNGLVLQVLLTGPAGGLDATNAERLLLSVIPDAVTNLGGYLQHAGPAEPAAPTVPTPTPAPVPAPTVPAQPLAPPVVTTPNQTVAVRGNGEVFTIGCADVASAGGPAIEPCTTGIQHTWDQIATRDPSAVETYVYDPTIGIFTSHEYTIEQTAILGLFACNAAEVSPAGGRAFWQGMMSVRYPEASTTDFDAAWTASFRILCPWLGPGE